VPASRRLAARLARIAARSTASLSRSSALAAGGGLGYISRALAHLTPQGGRPQGFAGTPLDRNVTLHRAAPRPTH
jgi:hypothetical protein